MTRKKHGGHHRFHAVFFHRNPFRIFRSCQALVSLALLSVCLQLQRGSCCFIWYWPSCISVSLQTCFTPFLWCSPFLFFISSNSDSIGEWPLGICLSSAMSGDELHPVGHQFRTSMLTASSQYIQQELYHQAGYKGSGDRLPSCGQYAKGWWTSITFYMQKTR